MTKIKNILLLLSLGSVAHGQSGLQEYLQAVKSNNKELQAGATLLQAQQINSRTGINPYNPEVEYGYMPGNSPELGNKTVFGVSQSFDFPTVYGTKRKIARQQDIVDEYGYRSLEQDLLLQAKLLYYEYVSWVKKEKEFAYRLDNAEKLYNSYNAKLQSGDASILETNKARILYLTMKSNYRLLQQEKENVVKDMLFINGGKDFSFGNPEYFTEPIQQLDSIKSQVMNNQPELLQLQEKMQVEKLNASLSKQNWLPGFEIGYESETEPDGTYGGVTAGMSIPLWEDKNTVKLAEANLNYAQSVYGASKSEVLAEVEKNYHKAMEYQAILKEYEETLPDETDTGFIEKAFDAGQLSIIEYITELSYYYDIIDLYLDIEKTYYQTLAVLYGYRL